MARSRRSRDDLDEDEDPPARRAARRHRHREPPTPMRSWEGDIAESEDGATEERAPLRSSRRPVFYRARDSLFFEPLVALALVILLLVGLYAYTQNWPPLYVVESNSMQHGTSDQVGLLNTGDLVLAQKIDPTHLQSYINGLQASYSTYGEFGDVVLYQQNGAVGTPIIHRVILYLTANADHTFSAPSLAGLPCGPAPNAVYRLSTGAGGCGWSHMTGTLNLLNVGWRSLNVSVALGSLGATSGFLTLGDNNPITDQAAGLSQLVQAGWILGVARGMIPWFGALKLALESNAGEVPSQSWQFMGLTIIALVLAAFGVHYALRKEGIEDERRKEQEEEEARARDDADALDDRPHHWRPLRGWLARGPPEDEEDDDLGSAPHHSSRPPGGPPTSGRQGRPRPRVKRGTLGNGHGRREKDSDPTDEPD
ncbi:MAG: S26 family signal peptidase [Thermoplasmata archaeon]|nr:S26 family signal peptidase [Thermoplasmata archaeon]